MTRKTNILLVSLVAMLSVGAVRAETATVSYVNTQDAKLADRIKTQDTRIGTIRDWVNPMDGDGNRATLATDAQDAYRAINELDAAIKAIDIPEQVNSDWNATEGVAQILNKPADLVTTSALNTALAGKQDTLQFDTTPTADSTKMVTSGAVAAAITAAQLDGEVDLTGYATETYVDSKIADIDIPEQQQSDWNATSGVAQILNKPDLTQFATTSDLADKQDTLTEAQLAAVNSGVTSTTVAQVGANTQAIAIQDQILATKANTADLAPVATSGDYADLTNTPTIPAAQVNSDWNATEGVAQILNKPTVPTAEEIVSPSELETTLADYAKSEDLDDYATLDDLAGKQDTIDSEHKLPASNVDGLAPVATSGDYADLTNTPTIPAAQVNSDWNATEGVAQILNKPTIPGDADIVSPTELETELAKKQNTIDENNKLPASNVDGLAPVATSGDYADLTNTPTIPAAQVQSDWAQADSTEVDFIKNKPTNLATETYVDEKVADVVAGDMSEALSAYVKKSEVEASLDSSSTNPVQNLVVTGALGEKVPLGNVPQLGQYVLGFVDGVQTYIPIVDAQGNAGQPVTAIASANEPGGGE